MESGHLVRIGKPRTTNHTQETNTTGPDAALKYLERAKSPRWEIEGYAYWGIIAGVISFILGWWARGVF